MTLKAVILLAGKGVRLHPISRHVPKCLLPIGSKPLLSYSIDNLLTAGVTSFIIVTGFESRQIRNFFHQSYPKLQATFVYNNKFETTGSLYSYYLAAPHILNTNYFRLDGDIIYSTQILNALSSSERTPICAIQKTKSVSDEDYTVVVNTKGNIIQFGKHITDKIIFGKAPGIEYVSATYSKKIYTSLHYLIRNHNQQSFAEKVYEYLATKNTPIHYTLLRRYDFWCEVDTKEDLLFAKNNIYKIAN